MIQSRAGTSYDDVHRRKMPVQARDVVIIYRTFVINVVSSILPALHEVAII